MTFALYRILGNDLPPLHAPSQTYHNLRFLLENEPDFEGCQKIWIVNRIVDTFQEQRILDLLNQRNALFIRIPFEMRVYRAICDMLAHNWPQNSLHSIEDRHARFLKCSYVMNVNGARNLALRDGRSKATWVLPLDGSCGFTEIGWREITSKLARVVRYDKAFGLPMYRLVNNSDFKYFTTKNQKWHEPQVVIGRDLNDEFDTTLEYGNMDKIAFLRRHHLPSGRGKGWAYLHRIFQLGGAPLCGHVIRLASGGDITARKHAVRKILSELDSIAMALSD